MNSFFEKYSFVCRWVAAIFLLGWLLSIHGGFSKRDYFGQPLGPDFLPFYTAASLLNQNRGAELYDFHAQIDLQSTILNSPQNYLHPYLNLPLFAEALRPLALLDYRLAFMLWTLLGLAILTFSAQKLGKHFEWSWLGWFPLFAAIAYGQNSFFSLGIVAVCSWLWVERNSPFRAGLVLGLLFYKPQLMVGLVLGFLILREWRVLFGVGMMGGIGALLSWIFLREETLNYFRFSSEQLPLLMAVPGAPHTQFFDSRGFLKLLLPALSGKFLMLGWGIVLLIAIILFWKWSQFSKSKNRSQRMAGIALLIPWGAPYLLLYDWTLLLVPFWLLSVGDFRNEKNREEIVGCLWIVALLSYPFSQWMFNHWGFAIQLAPLVLGVFTYRFFRKE